MIILTGASGGIGKKIFKELSKIDKIVGRVVNPILYAMIFSCLTPFFTQSTLFKHLGCFSSYYLDKCNKKASHINHFCLDYFIKG